MAKNSEMGPDDKLHFLIVCIKHTANGKPDFDAVARDLSIVSKAAAAKRYERMLKSIEVGPSSATAGVAEGSDAPPSTPASKGKITKGTPASTRKRKTPAKKQDDDSAESEGVKTGENDDGDVGAPTPAPKKTPRKPRAKKEVKSEDEVKNEVADDKTGVKADDGDNNEEA